MGGGGFLPIIKSRSNSSWGWVGLWQLTLAPYKIDLLLKNIGGKLQQFKKKIREDSLGLPWHCDKNNKIKGEKFASVHKMYLTVKMDVTTKNMFRN